MSKHAPLKRTTLILFLLVLGYLISYGYNAFLARHFSAEDYGNISIILKIILLLLPLVLLGSDSSLVRFLPPLLEANNHEQSSLFLHWVLHIVGWACVAISLFFMLSAVVLFFTKHPSLIGQHYDALLAALILPIATFIIVFSKVLRCHNKYYASILLNTIMQNMFFLGALVIAFYFFKTSSFHSVFASLLLSFTLVLVLQLAILAPIIKKSSPQKISIKGSPEWLQTTLCYMLNSFIFFALISIDLLMLEGLGHSEKEVGYFSALLAICGVFYLLSQASSVIINTKISIYCEQNRHDDLEKLLRNAFLFNMTGGLVLFMAIGIFGKLLLESFGQEYTHYYWPLLALAFGTLLTNATVNAASVINYTPHYKKAIPINIISLLVAIAIDVIFIPIYGIYAAVASLIVVGSMANLVKALRAKQFLKIKQFVIF